MNDLDEKLDVLFLEIINEDITPKKVKAMLDEMTLSYGEVANTIVPFLERIEDIGMDGMKLGNADHFFYIGEIIQVFVEKYFNQVKENGYYKATKILFSKNWFCTQCNKFFDVPKKMGKKKLTEIKCTHCKSPQWHNSNSLKKVLADYTLN